MKTEQEKLKEIAEVLREIHKTNDGPRLITEMLEEFKPRRKSSHTGQPMSHNLK